MRLRSSETRAERVRHERLARVAGNDAHAQHEVSTCGLSECRRAGRRRPRAERDPHREPELASYRGHPGRVIRCLDVKGHRVRTRLRELREVVDGVVDHQMAVDDPSGGVDRRGDRAEDDRPDRDRRDEMPVAAVEVEDPATTREQCLDLLTEPVEVGRVERRRDLDVVADPLVPAHESTVPRVAAGSSRTG